MLEQVSAPRFLLLNNISFYRGSTFGLSTHQLIIFEFPLLSFINDAAMNVMYTFLCEYMFSILESTSQCRKHKRPGFNSWVGKVPLNRKWHPTPVLLPGNPMNRGTWWVIIHGIAKTVNMSFCTPISKIWGLQFLHICCFDYGHPS